MASPQPDKYTKLSNELLEAILRADLTKRQLKIILFLFRLSYGCRKENCIVKQADFQEAGIYRSDIKEELEYLQLSKLITMKKCSLSGQKDCEQYYIVAFIKDYDEWKRSLSKPRFSRRNLDISDPIKRNLSISKIQTEELVKQQHYCLQNTNSSVSKIHIQTPANSLSPNKNGAGKDILKTIKDNIKEIYKEKFKFLKDKNFSKAFQDYLDMRKEKKKPATDRAKELVLIALHRHDVKTAITMLERSITNSWTDVYKLKPDKPQQQSKLEKNLQKIADFAKEE